ncbi:MAG: V-type ATPase subunit [Oscillospiraceae bacterium]
MGGSAIKDKDFLEASKGLREENRKLISPSSLRLAAERPDFPSALELIRDRSSYPFTGEESPEEVGPLLSAGLKAFFALAYSLTPQREVVDIPATWYDFAALRVALQAAYAQGGGEAPPLFSVGGVEESELAAFADRDNDLLESALPSHLLESGLRAREIREKTGSAHLADAFLNGRCFAWMKRLSLVVENDYISGYLASLIDCYNIYTLVRFREVQRDRAFLESLLVPGGRTEPGDLAGMYARTLPSLFPSYYHKLFGETLREEVERCEKAGGLTPLRQLMDNLLAALTKNVEMIDYGAEVVFCELLAKHNELRQIRSLLSGKASGVSSQTLLEGLQNRFLTRSAPPEQGS